MKAMIRVPFAVAVRGGMTFEGVVPLRIIYACLSPADSRWRSAYAPSSQGSAQRLDFHENKHGTAPGFGQASEGTPLFPKGRFRSSPAPA
jgi:hypothetical protein